MCQAPNLEHLLWKSKFMPVEENFHVTFCGKNCVCSPYLLKASPHLFKRINSFFFYKIILLAGVGTLSMSLMSRLQRREYWREFAKVLYIIFKRSVEHFNSILWIKWQSLCQCQVVHEKLLSIFSLQIYCAITESLR